MKKRGRNISARLVMGISAAVFMAWTLWTPVSTEANTGSIYGILHTFASGPNDGSKPVGSLVLSGSKYYGMTMYGGGSGTGSNDGNGVIFSIDKGDTSGTTFTVLHAFAGGHDDGNMPSGSLVVSGSTLYGVTVRGGQSTGNGNGVIFSIGTDGSGFTVLHRFASDYSEGGFPCGTPVLYGSALYGMTQQGGGSSMCGTIYKFDLNASMLTVMHGFSGAADDGWNPVSGALTLVGSTFYGMTSGGGANSYGAIFKIGADGQGFALLHSFAGGTSDGSGPWGSLVLSGATLYGMTTYGGGGGCVNTNNIHSQDYEGVIFKIDANDATGSSYRVLHSFQDGASDGAYPQGDLIVSGNILYGMTHAGGDSYTCGGGHYYGTVFQMSMDGTGFRVLHAFNYYNASNGGYPDGTLTVSDAIYGMAGGGSNWEGVIFSLTIPPVAGFTANPTSGVSPLSVAFTDMSAGCSPTSWSWSFGDGGTDTIKNPTHTYASPGVYSVSLTASNGGGSSTKSITGFITVNAPHPAGIGSEALWSGSGSYAGYGCILNYDASRNCLGYTLLGPYGGWTPTSLARDFTDYSSRVLWTSTGGQAAILKYDSSQRYVSYVSYGPYPGWTPVSYARGSDGQGRLLWKNTDGTACLFVLDSSDNYLSYSSWGPYPGWAPRGVHRNRDGSQRLIWEYNDGSIIDWVINSAGQYTAFPAFPSINGWKFQSYNQGSDGSPYLVWNWNGGSFACVWKMDPSDNYSSYVMYGPYTGWTLVGYE